MSEAVRILEEVGDTTSFGRLLGLVVREVETGTPSGANVPETYVERSLAREGEIGSGYPRLFTGIETTEVPVVEAFVSDEREVIIGEGSRTVKPYRWFNPETGLEQEIFEIAHVNIGSIAGKRPAQYRHSLTSDRKVIREVFCDRRNEEKLPVEQSHVLGDEAIDALVKRLSA